MPFFVCLLHEGFNLIFWEILYLVSIKLYNNLLMRFIQHQYPQLQQFTFKPKIVLFYCKKQFDIKKYFVNKIVVEEYLVLNM